VLSGLLDVEGALEHVLAHAVVLSSERVPLSAAAGRVLAAPATSPVDVPPFPSSAMDGYAVRAGDAPGPLEIVGHVAAGRPADEPLASGAAMAISTGGAVPAGADTVVPIEHVVQTDNGSVEIPRDVVAGAHVRPRGGDVEAGEVVLPAGSRLGAAQIGALAAVGLEHAVVTRRPRVTVLTTGSELRPPGAELAPGEIFESNGVMLAAILDRAGADVDVRPAVTDDESAHRSAIAAGLEADALVTSGGVSVGEHDLVRRVEAELGVEEVFWGVAVKPGKPVSFGVRGRTLVFGLPGNPVSALVGALLFVRPGLLALQGARDPRPPFEEGRLAAPLRGDPRRATLVRATSELSPRGVVLTPVAGQDSHMIVRAARADALVYVGSGAGELPAGAAVRYLRLA
jgi:molybdopterin molybdotransferase